VVTLDTRVSLDKKSGYDDFRVEKDGYQLTAEVVKRLFLFKCHVDNFCVKVRITGVISKLGSNSKLLYVFVCLDLQFIAITFVYS